MKCDNCQRELTRSELANVFPEISHLEERIEPSGLVPEGECPDCGALVYSSLVVKLSVHGGVVHLVYLPPGIEVDILDYDVDGGENLDSDDEGIPCRHIIFGEVE